ncbi:hypothetical protein B0H19DRAFT_1168545 [Mycena capillaripes]|nr:hypothetical protein B0H19DRAFT_1201711 [Mycena capillaripes]KAJ6545791.1 hypothetical protein B0H19DRAFT_1168545 [Mycena capillaripes]
MHRGVQLQPPIRNRHLHIHPYLAYRMGTSDLLIAATILLSNHLPRVPHGYL